MELYGCGRNDDGYLGEPRSCLRREVSYHFCKHNGSEKGCPFWALKLKTVLKASKTIRILNVAGGAPIFLLVDNELKGLGRGPNVDLGYAEVAEKPEGVISIVPLCGRSEVAFLLKDGSLRTVDKQEDGKHVIVQHLPAAGREILLIAARSAEYHNPALVSGAIALVAKSRPQEVLSFPAWNSMLGWLQGESEPIHVASLSSPVIQVTSKFAALTESGTVYTWGDKTPDQPTPPPEDNEEFEHVEFMYDLFGGTAPKYPPRQPERLDYNPTQAPLPEPVSKLATGGYNAFVSKSQRLYVWTSSRVTTKPEVQDANELKAPSKDWKTANITDADGNPLHIVDVSTGRRHVVALAADNSLWSVGDGMMGELGIGTKQFGLCTPDHVEDFRDNEIDEEFAETWQRMDDTGLLEDGWKWDSVYADEDCTFVIAKKVPA